MKNKSITVARYLTEQIALSGVPQKEIAAFVGYDKPNMITMLKQGLTKVPVNKVAPLAKILGVNPLHFLRLVMNEYQPETWKVLEELLGQKIVSENEHHILDLIRTATKGRDIRPRTPAQEKQLQDLFTEWAKHDAATSDASVKATMKRGGDKVVANEYAAEESDDQ